MKHLARSSLIIALFFAVDKGLGLIRQLVVARNIGLTYNLDAFNAANNIPDMLSALISGGALGVALIPVLSDYLETKGRPESWKLFVRILNLAFIITTITSIILAFAAPYIIRYYITPGFPEAHKLLTTELMRLDLIAIIIFSISGLVMAGLQANQHFLLPAMAPALYNIGQIFGVTILSPSTPMHIGPVTLPAFGLGVHGLVYGVILGSLLHLAIQIPGLIHYEFKWSPTINLRDPGVRQVLSLMGPRVVTVFFIQLIFISTDRLASSLGEGSITALNLGWFVMQVPETLLGTAIAIALLPTMSELYADHDREAFSQTINTALRVMLAFTIPSAFILAAGIQPLVQTAFSFPAAGTELVVLATRGYLLGLIGHSLLEIASRAFYAQKNAIIPLASVIIKAIIFYLMASLLSSQVGLVGIAITNSTVFTLEALVLLWLLNRAYPGLFNVTSTLLRVVPITLACAISVYAIVNIAPFSPLILSLGSMALAMGIVIPFILPEVRSMLKLGTRK